MQKTKFGISVGMLGAAIYFMGLYGGYLITGLLAAYVLLFETNEWLKKTAVKAVVLMVCFSIMSTVIYLLPDVIDIISNIAGLFGGAFFINIISRLSIIASGVLAIAEMVLFIGLGLKALTQGSITVPVVDKVINKYM